MLPPVTNRLPARFALCKTDFNFQVFFNCYLQTLSSSSVQWFHTPEAFKSTTQRFIIKCLPAAFSSFFAELLISGVSVRLTCTDKHTNARALSRSLFLFPHMYKHFQVSSTLAPLKQLSLSAFFISKPRWHHSRIVAYQRTRNGFCYISYVCSALTAGQHPVLSGKP